MLHAGVRHEDHRYSFIIISCSPKWFFILVHVRWFRFFILCSAYNRLCTHHYVSESPSLTLIVSWLKQIRQKSSSLHVLTSVISLFVIIFFTLQSRLTALLFISVSLTVEKQEINIKWIACLYKVKKWRKWKIHHFVSKVIMSHSGPVYCSNKLHPQTKGRINSSVFWWWNSWICLILKRPPHVSHWDKKQ